MDLESSITDKVSDEDHMQCYNEMYVHVHVYLFLTLMLDTKPRYNKNTLQGANDSANCVCLFLHIRHYHAQASCMYCWLPVSI